jgi:hypothetical protein
LCIFFVSGVFLNFDVDFWPLLKAEKLIPRSILAKKKKSLIIVLIRSITLEGTIYKSKVTIAIWEGGGGGPGRGSGL